MCIDRNLGRTLEPVDTVLDRQRGFPRFRLMGNARMPCKRIRIEG